MSTGGISEKKLSAYLPPVSEWALCGCGLGFPHCGIEEL